MSKRNEAVERVDLETVTATGVNLDWDDDCVPVLVFYRHLAGKGTETVARVRLAGGVETRVAVLLHDIAEHYAQKADILTRHLRLPGKAMPVT